MSCSYIHNLDNDDIYITQDNDIPTNSTTTTNNNNNHDSDNMKMKSRMNNCLHQYIPKQDHITNDPAPV
ncbi:hypothetical protein PFDG_05374, partial [Plasmodium falciparum Dd2]